MHGMKFWKVPLLAAIMATAFCCQEKEQGDDVLSYELVEEDGIFVEVFDSTVVDETRYTQNNQTYRAGATFVYDYYYEDVEGRQFWFKHDPDPDRKMILAWDFVPAGDTSGQTIREIVLKVTPGLSPFIERIPDYNQTVIRYDFIATSGEMPLNEMTGVIENERNVWIHPPRSKFFRILEINPFPFIQAPYEVGNQWTWTLGIGDFWGDERWKTWEGSIENQYLYEITGQSEFETKLGKLTCFEVTATATSRIGTTHLTALFHSTYGFVKLDYTNIDGTRTVLELKEVSLAGK